MSDEPNSALWYSRWRGCRKVRPGGQSVMNDLLLSLPVGETYDQCERPTFLKNLGHLTEASMAIFKALETVKCVIGKYLPLV